MLYYNHNANYGFYYLHFSYILSTPSVPFYGKTFSYATELNGWHSQTKGRFGGFVDQANWPQDLGTPVFYNIVKTLSKGQMLSRRHEPTKTQYAYFQDGTGLGELLGRIFGDLVCF